MSRAAAVMTALGSGAVGMVAAGAVANACVVWFRISSFEGKSGYFVVGLALLGLVLGVVIGIVVPLVLGVLRPPAGAGTAFAGACGVVVGLAGVAAVVCRAVADVPPTLDGRELMLEVEIRLPADEQLPDAATAEDSFVSLGSVVRGQLRNTERGLLGLDAARAEGGRVVVPGEVFVYTSRGARALQVHLAGRFRGAFFLPLPAYPRREFEDWSDWLPYTQADGAPWPESEVSYRFRVRRQ